MLAAQRRCDVATNFQPADTVHSNSSTLEYRDVPPRHRCMSLCTPASPHKELPMVMTRHRLTHCFLFSLMVGLTASTACASDWPRSARSGAGRSFRRDLHRGNWDQSPPKLAWMVEGMGQGYAGRVGERGSAVYHREHRRWPVGHCRQC